VSVKDLIIWDDDRAQCCGFLNKKASQSSAFSKGKWQKRWFLIDIDIDDTDNYCLEYFHGPDDSKSRQAFPLTRMSIKVSGGNSFLLNYGDEVALTLSAESKEVMKMWIETLENVISVSNMRERMLKELGNMSGGVEGSEEGKKTSRYAAMKSEMGISATHETSGAMSPARSPSKSLRTNPAVRLDVDAESIPPTSKNRHQFLELFIDDISKALEILPEMVEVLSVKPAPGMDWLTMVEFDINPIRMLQDNERTDPRYLEQLELERIDMRSKLLWSLHDMVTDPSSILYNGFVTSKLDPTFTANLIDKEEEEDEIVPYSSDPQVLRIMEQYKDIHVPPMELDLTHITIELFFEDKSCTVSVPNPLILRKRCCALWPYEVKDALGFMGNMQELWIEPVALVPRDMPKMLSQPIPFEPSVRCGGQKLINATRLKGDQAYDVLCEDRRDEALNSLSPEEMEAIKETFRQCDINGDGGISRAEMSELVRHRVQERKEIIDEKFDSFVNEPGVTRDEIASAESNKSMLLQSLHESQNKLLKMFEAADTNGDGILSFTEFIMAEAWWLRCTINPERAHLF